MVQTMTADSTALELGFDDLTVLSTGGVDVFVYNMNEGTEVPPYYITLAGRRFHFTGASYLEQGHGAELPEWVREEEAAGRLAIFVQRDERLLVYSFDPTVVEDDDEDDEGAAAEADDADA